jgi:DNA-binding NarL/FixJ family response regulator
MSVAVDDRIDAVDAADSPLDIVVVDDAPLFRGLLAQVLAPLGSIREAAATGDALVALRLRRPDIVILDVRMPPTYTVEGLDAALRLRSRHPDVGVLLLSNDIQVRHVDRMLAEGGPAGVGYLLKERVTGVGEFLAAVRAVAAGGHAVDPEVVTALLAKKRTATLLARLSDREREVLALMAQGLSNVAIAGRLLVSTKTVEATIRQLLTELELPYDAERNRRVLAVLAFLGEADSSALDPSRRATMANPA